jgi:hypothetical protein
LSCNHNGNQDEIGNYLAKLLFNCKVKSGANLIDIKANKLSKFISKHFKRSNGLDFKVNSLVDNIGNSPENPKNKPKPVKIIP